jgi:hypothetical protein
MVNDARSGSLYVSNVKACLLVDSGEDVSLRTLYPSFEFTHAYAFINRALNCCPTSLCVAISISVIPKLNTASSHITTPLQSRRSALPIIVILAVDLLQLQRPHPHTHDTFSAHLSRCNTLCIIDTPSACTLQSPLRLTPSHSRHDEALRLQSRTQDSVIAVGVQQPAQATASQGRGLEHLRSWKHGPWFRKVVSLRTRPTISDS